MTLYVKIDEQPYFIYEMSYLKNIKIIFTFEKVFCF